MSGPPSGSYWRSARLCALIALPALLLASAVSAAVLYAGQWLQAGQGPELGSVLRLGSATALVMATVAVLPALLLALWQAWGLWRGRHRASALLAAGCGPGLLALVLSDGSVLAWVTLLLGAVHALLVWAGVRGWLRRYPGRS